MRTRIAVLLLFAACGSGCSLAPTFERPSVAVPQGWSAADVPVGARPGALPFWQALGSDELSRLEDIALAQNLDLQAALHRVEQARAQAKVAGAALWPTLDASGGAVRTYAENGNGSSWRGLASLSYELDLWGRNRDSRAAAAYRASASHFDREALRLVVAADTALLYSQALGFNERIRFAESNLKNAEEVLRIIEARFQAGSVSALEVSQQRVAVNNLRSALTALREQQAVNQNALAILLGLPPQIFSGPTAELDSLRLPAVNLTPPAELLTARPDIQSVEALLRAANADIGAARAAFFPSLTIGADTSIAAAGFGSPANAAVSLAANVLAPIFSGGRLTGNLESVTARQKELAAQYQKTVLTAFREVEDALADFRASERQVMLARESVREAQNAYNIAKARFDAGAIDYLTLLETQRSLTLAEDEQVVAAVARIGAFLQLRKALGW